MSVKGVLRLGLAAAGVAVIGGGAYAIFGPGSSSQAPTPAGASSRSPAPTGSPAASAGALAVYSPIVRVTLESTSVMYFTIVNHGPADSLRSISCDASPLTTLHNTITQGYNSTMVQLQQIPIPANGTVTLQSGGLHVMIEQITKPLVTGDKVHCDLTFAQAGKVSLVAPVLDYGQ